MYHTNAAYKQKVANLPQNYRMEVEVIYDAETEYILYPLLCETGEALETEQGETLEYFIPAEKTSIPPEDIFEAGFSENVFLSTFCVGSSVRAEFWVRIFNKDGKYKNNALATAEIRPKVTLYDSETGEAVDTVPLGVFYVDKITIQDSDLRLACYDKMSLLEKPYTPQNTQNSLLEVAKSIALSVLAPCPDTPAQVPALQMVVDDSIFQGYSKRQVLELIAEASGSFAAFDQDGALRFKWFSNTGIELRADMAKTPLELNGNTFSLDGNVVKVTGVRIVGEDTELAHAGTDEYLLTINENPIAAAHPEEVARFVLERLSDTQYIPCKWTRIGGDPSLQVGDIVTVVDNKTAFDEAKAEEYDRYPLYLSAQSWTFNCGGFSDVYTSAGNAEKDLNTDKGMTVSKRLSQLAKRITEAKKELTYEMDERQKALLLFNETIAGSMGLYTTYKQQEDGAYICYMHDEPELEESQTIYTFGASGFAWTTSGWNDGAPLWQYGFDRDGNAILNAIFAYKLTADVITSGLLKSKNGASYINMDDGTFCFRAIKEAWMDTDTGEMSYEYEKVLELADKVLNVFGTLRSTQYPNYSVSIGESETGNTGAFTVTDKGEGYGDIFQTYVVVSENEKGCIWTAPFTLNAGKTNRKGISVWPNEISIFNDANGKNAHLNITTDDFELTNGVLFVGSRHASFQINSNFSGDLFFNFYKPTEGYQVNKYVFCKGTDSGADKADIWCGAIEASGSIVSNYGITSKGQIYAAGSIFTDGGLDAKGNLNTLKKLTVSTGNFIYDEQCASFGGNVSIGAGYFPGYMFSVLGQAKAHAWVVASERNEKENIIEKSNVIAIDGIKSLRFYSYDYKPNEVTQNSKAKNTEATVQTVQLNSSATVEAEESEKTPVHVELGIMTDEAPEEILGDDGKGINLYAYTSYVAKAVQEIIDKCEKQEQRIADLEAELQALKNEKST